MDDFRLSMDKRPSSDSIGTASIDAVKTRSEGASEGQLSQGTGPVRVDRVLQAPKISQNLVSVAGLRNVGHIGLVTENNYVIKRQRNIFGVGRRTDCIYDDVRSKMSGPSPCCTREGRQ